MIYLLSMMCISSRMMGITMSDSFNISLYDGYSWSDATTVDIEFGTNTTPELRSPSDGNTISGTVNGTIRTNEQRALSEYISYYDNPNEHELNQDGSAYHLTAIRPIGDTSLKLGWETLSSENSKHPKSIVIPTSGMA